jgi:DNA processing protein
MSVFGLEAGQVRRLVTDVSPGVELDDDDVADRFARAAWSVIAEPGDGTAGALVAQLGAAEALRFVLLEQSRADPPARSVQLSGSVAGAKPAIAAVGSNAVADDPLTQGDVRAAAAQNATATAPQPGAQASRFATGQDPNGELAAGIERWRPRLRSSAVERVLHLAARIGATLIVPGRLREQPLPWPAGVDDLGAHAPIALWARGSIGRLSRNPPGVALVGARAATGYGEHVASELSAGLVELGLPIVSGAAYGIDGMAHRAALASGGLTLAFLAGGVDRFYPAGHDDLLRRITEHGLVLSEVPCGTAPTKWRFLQRNRLIAACSAATVVVEAGARSGSLNTAGHASALGRPLGAVPGPVTSPASAGCHRLLREYDAVCVTNAREVAELIGPLAVPSPDSAVGAARASRDSPEAVRVLDALATRTPRTPAELAARSGLGLGPVLAVLGTLEIEGRAKEDAEGWRAVPRSR